MAGPSRGRVSVPNGSKHHRCNFIEYNIHTSIHFHPLRSALWLMHIHSVPLVQINSCRNCLSILRNLATTIPWKRSKSGLAYTLTNFSGPTNFEKISDTLVFCRFWITALNFVKFWIYRFDFSELKWYSSYFVEIWSIYLITILVLYPLDMRKSKKITKFIIFHFPHMDSHNNKKIMAYEVALLSLLLQFMYVYLMLSSPLPFYEPKMNVFVWNAKE